MCFVQGVFHKLNSTCDVLGKVVIADIEIIVGALVGKPRWHRVDFIGNELNLVVDSPAQATGSGAIH